MIMWKWERGGEKVDSSLLVLLRNIFLGAISLGRMVASVIKLIKPMKSFFVKENSTSSAVKEVFYYTNTHRDILLLYEFIFQAPNVE